MIYIDSMTNEIHIQTAAAYTSLFVLIVTILLHILFVIKKTVLIYKLILTLLFNCLGISIGQIFISVSWC